MRKLVSLLLLASLLLAGCGRAEEVCLNPVTTTVHEPARTELRPKIGGLNGMSYDGNPSVTSGSLEMVFIPAQTYTRTTCSEWATPTPQEDAD